MDSANEDDVVFDGGDEQDVELNLDDVDGLDASYDNDEEVLEVAGNQ